MQKISLSQAKVGMMLASDVMTADGKVLASAGSSVDEAMLRRLDLAGIAKFVVRGKPVPGADMGYDAYARAQRVQHLFRAHQNDSFMMALQELLLQHFTDRA
jgi:hypothetical protein